MKAAARAASIPNALLLLALLLSPDNPLELPDEEDREEDEEEDREEVEGEGEEEEEEAAC